MSLPTGTRVEIYNDHPLSYKYIGKTGIVKSSILRKNCLIYRVDYGGNYPAVIGHLFLREVSNSVRFIRE